VADRPARITDQGMAGSLPYAGRGTTGLFRRGEVSHGLCLRMSGVGADRGLLRQGGGRRVCGRIAERLGRKPVDAQPRSCGAVT